MGGGSRQIDRQSPPPPPPPPPPPVLHEGGCSSWQGEVGSQTCSTRCLLLRVGLVQGACCVHPLPPPPNPTLAPCFLPTSGLQQSSPTFRPTVRPRAEHLIVAVAVWPSVFTGISHFHCRLQVCVWIRVRPSLSARLHQCVTLIHYATLAASANFSLSFVTGTQLLGLLKKNVFLSLLPTLIFPAELKGYPLRGGFGGVSSWTLGVQESMEELCCV